MNVRIFYGQRTRKLWLNPARGLNKIYASQKKIIAGLFESDMKNSLQKLYTLTMDIVPHFLRPKHA